MEALRIEGGSASMTGQLHVVPNVRDRETRDVLVTLTNVQLTVIGHRGPVGLDVRCRVKMELTHVTENAYSFLIHHMVTTVRGTTLISKHAMPGLVQLTVHGACGQIGQNAR